LATTDDARVHCAVLKIRAVPVRSRAAGQIRSWPRCGCRSDRSLRTQQRARSRRPPGRRSVPQAGVLTGRAGSADRITSAPLTSGHPGTDVQEMALGTPTG
jgi:hypothetical protein